MATRPLKVGDKVIVGDHNIDGRVRDWGGEMEPYVGKVATITRYAHRNGTGTAWYIDIDGGLCFWYENNMKLAIENPNLKCKDCLLPTPHGEPNKDGVYICDFCKAANSLAEPTAQEKYETNWEATFGKSKLAQKKFIKTPWAPYVTNYHGGRKSPY